MVRHIVTVGTSQIGPVKLKTIFAPAESEPNPPDDGYDVIKAVSRGNLPSALLPDDDKQAFGSIAVKGSVYTEVPRRVADQIIKNWDSFVLNGTGFNSPFGAELSTLLMMTQEEEPVFRPGEDEVMLLYTDSPTGLLCAGIVGQVLTKGPWHTPSDGIRFNGVGEDFSRNQSDEDVISSIWETMFDARIQNGGNSWVLSGGFKSIPPIATLCAAIFRENLYYLYETSDKLMSLSLPTRVVERGFISQLTDRIRKEGDRYILEVSIPTENKAVRRDI